MYDDDLKSKLLLAVDADDEDLVRHLLDSGEEIEAGPFGYTPLMAAVERNHLGIIRLLIERGSNIDAADVDEATALFYAHSANAARLLLEAGASPLHQDICGYFSLSLADDVATANLLLEWCPELEDGHRSFTEGVHIAARTGSVTMMRFHLKHGGHADGNRPRTPLMDAAMRSHPATAQLLLQHGAGLDKRDRQGRTALHYAAAPEATVIGDRRRYARLLDCSPIERQREGDTAIELSEFGLIVSDDTSLIDLLIEHGAELESSDHYDMTPLLLSCATGRFARATRLLELGADPFTTDRWRRDAAGCARKNPDPAQRDLITELLKSAGSR